jgi:hypothetical protein
MRVIPCLLILLLACSMRVEADDGIRRCIGPDGVSIYTDRPCDTFNAVDRKAPPVSGTHAAPDIDTPTGFTRSDCARRADTLLFDLRRAIESDNVNQLAGLYHWPGIGRRASTAIMDRLERVVAQPLASVELVYPDIAPVLDDPGAFPPGTPSEDPTGIRILQVDPGEIEPRYRQDLRLVRHAACWWIAF